MSEEKLNEAAILDNTDLEEKVALSFMPRGTVTARAYITESCEVAELLPPRQKMLFLMYYSHGVSKTDIAEICNVSPRAVGKRLSEISTKISEIKKSMAKEKNGQSYKSTKMRIDAYFRGQKNGRRSTGGSKSSKADI